MQHRSSEPLPHITPPYDLTTYRSNDGSGGQPERGRVRGARPMIERSNGDPRSNDKTTYKFRIPFMRTGNYIPAADPIRPMDSGPLRPELHMLVRTWRRWSGGAFQDQAGWHTSTKSIRAAMMAGGGPAQQNSPTAAMNRGLQKNYLTQSRYRGQSYSQTTTVR